MGAVILTGIAGATALCLLIIFGRGSGLPAMGSPPAYRNKPVKGKIVLRVDEESMPILPKTVNVYRLRFPLTTVPKMEECARKFGIDTSMQFYVQITGSKKYFAVKDELRFDCDPPCQEYRFRDKAFEGLAKVTYSDQEIAGIALEKLFALGLLPEDGGQVTKVGGERVWRTEDGQEVSYYVSRRATVSRTLDGGIVIGPGMELTATFGEGGKLVELHSTMREPVIAGKYPVKSVEEAVRDAQEGKGTMNLHPEVQNPVVSLVKLIYYADPANDTNDILQPVYMLSGPDTCIYIPAVRQ